jgi:hypothetical protein
MVLARFSSSLKDLAIVSINSDTACFILRADLRAEAIVWQLVIDQLIVTQLLLRFETFQNAPNGILSSRARSHMFLRVPNCITALWGRA